jgi:integrase
MTADHSIPDPTPNNPAEPSGHSSGEPAKPEPESKPRRIPKGFQPFNSPGNTAPASAREKPAKPTPDFPLFPHATGRWAKKIRGKLHYFGKWEDPDGALRNYLEQKDALHAGRTPREETAEGLTVKGLANAFLNHKQHLVETGELSPLTWNEYRTACDLVVATFGKNRLVDDLGPDDFARLRVRMAHSWGPLRLVNMIQYVRSIFKHGTDAGLINRVVRFGPGFDRPSKKVLRLHRARQGPKLFTAAEVHQLLQAAGVQLKAMILLGINCGFGNSDCGNLPLTALDLDNGWIDFPRPKTGIARRCPLWPETTLALRQHLASRPEPKDQAHAGLVFVTGCGLPWNRKTSDTPIARKLWRLFKTLGIKHPRGTGFYTLRHTFRTVADESKDQPACDHIMGHLGEHISTVYRERISDERLKAVTDHVRAWLFGQGQPSG